MDRVFSAADAILKVLGERRRGELETPVVIDPGGGFRVCGDSFSRDEVDQALIFLIRCGYIESASHAP
jgi:hypothetical protein